MNQDRQQWFARLRAASYISGYDITVMLRGKISSAMEADRATQEYCPHRVTILRSDIVDADGYNDLKLVMSRVVEHFENTNHTPDTWSAVLLGGVIYCDFRNEKDAVRIKLMINIR